MTSFLSPEELKTVGFRSVGKDVKISRKASFYHPQTISIGDGSRIDDFCILSAGPGGIEIGRYVHVSAYASLLGGACMKIGDYSAVSVRVSIFSNNDDYSGEFMANPTVPMRYRNMEQAPVTLEKHSLIGCGSIILPGVTIGEGVAVGSLSLVNTDLQPFWIYAGVPAKKIKERSRNLLKLEKEWRAE